MGENVRIVCPKCKAAYRVRGEAPPGAKVTCRKCGQEMVVPEPRERERLIGRASVAGSDDDQRVSLGPRGEPEPPTAEGDLAEESVEALLDGAGGAGSPRYVEQGVIGQGGMGQIVLCVERNTRRQVAMKRMLPETAARPTRRARFVEEAQVTAQLEHPNIVPVHELDATADGAIYFTMKLVKGRSLADILGAARRGEESPSLGELLQIFLKVCDGVAFAHSRGVIHRDLKPSNIMVGDFGEVLVMDWGLAKIVGREDAAAEEAVVSSRAESGGELYHTQAGKAMGSPGYMAPEQAAGRIGEIDPRSDIYSLGAILYEMLSLSLPVEGASGQEIVAKTIRGEIIPLARGGADCPIPRELAAVAMKCLSLSPDHRYQSVGDLQRDVNLFLEGRSVSAAPDTFTQAVAKLINRNKPVSAAIAAATVILIAVVSVAFVRVTMSMRRAIRGERQAVAARQKQRATALAASEQLARQAVRAASEGRFAEADVRADAAVKVLPDGPWGHYALGVVAFERKDFAAAGKHLEEALRVDPSHRPSKLLHLSVLAAAGKLAEWEKLVAGAEQSEDWSALVAAGDALYRAQRYAASVKAYERALVLMERSRAVAPGVLAEVKDKAARSVACIKTEGFYESIRHLPPKNQARLVVAKLKEVYGNDVSISVPGIDERGVAGIHLKGGANVRWLDPIRGMPLTTVDCNITSVSDLSPLQGMPLTYLSVHRTQVTSLAPLKGMPLTFLNCSRTKVSDLSPLQGMPLTDLNIYTTQVSSLAPLKGMPLRTLVCGSTSVSDLSPLQGMPLAVLDCSRTRVSDLGPLSGIPLERLRVAGTSVADLGPLRGMRLTHLVVDDTYVSDLIPLAGMPLRELRCQGTRVSDVSPLKGMPLHVLNISRTKLTDLTPLAGMKLMDFRPPPRRQLTPGSLKVIETLQKQGCKVLWPE